MTRALRTTRYETSTSFRSNEADPYTDEERIADFRCGSSIEIEGQYNSLLGHEEADFWYDYHKEVLVPCLALRGYELSEVPTREEFAGWGGTWNPYFVIFRVDQDQADLDRLMSECPPVPPGATDPGWFGLN